jgi:CubicO group peptidase (beta-lactamase class C family)
MVSELMALIYSAERNAQLKIRHSSFVIRHIPREILKTIRPSERRTNRIVNESFAGRLFFLIFCIGCLLPLSTVTGLAQSDEISTNDYPQHDFQAWPDQVAAHFSQITVGGYAFMARDHGKIVVSRVGGYARMPYEKEGAGERWTALTPMHVASVSKAITGTALVKLWEEKHESFSFDEPFWPYVKDLFPNATGQSRHITIRQLLTHESGLVQLESVFHPLKDAADALACATNGAPGLKSQYNNLNYYLLRLVIERISGQPYPQYVRSHVLLPCGAANMNTMPEGRWPLLCYASNGATNLPGNAMPDFAASAGAFGWYASTLDLSAFVYGASSGKLISKKSAEMMFHDGFGWTEFKSGSRVVGYGHDGGWSWYWIDFDGTTSGHASSYAVHFLDGVDAAVLVNSDQAGRAGGLPRLLLDLWLGNDQTGKMAAHTLKAAELSAGTN